MRRYPWLPLLMAALTCHVAHAFEIVFDRDVKPILAKCTECHGDEQRMGTLRLDSRDGALVGGRAGVAIIPGDADRSRVYLRVHYASDVAVGYTVGLCWLIVSLELLKRIEEYNKQQGNLPPVPVFEETKPVLSLAF